MSNEERRSSIPPPATLSDCPSCGKVVDTLRAGEVAILGGGFRYFCDRACKQAYLDALQADARFHEGATAEPPKVAPSVAPREVLIGLEDESLVKSSKEDLDKGDDGDAEVADDDAETPLLPLAAIDEAAEKAATATATASTVADGSDENSEKTAETEAETEPDESEAETVPIELPPLREGLSAPSRASLVPLAPASIPPESLRARALRSSASASRLAPIRNAGIAIGLLATLAAAVPGAHVAALPMTCLTAALAIACAFFSDARPPRSRVPREWPIGVALVAALLAHAKLATGGEGVAALGGMHAFALDALTSLLSVSLLAGEALFARGRAWATQTHAAIATALDVPVRVVRGDAVETVEASRVKPGETVIVAEGETCGVDGAIGGGDARVIPWHGARTSEMQTKREGDVIVAGAIVTSGSIRVTTAWTGRDRAWIKLAAAGEGSLDVAAPLTRLSAQIVEIGPFAAAAVLGTAAYLTHSGTAEIIGAAAAGGGVLTCLALVRAVAMVHGDGHVASLERGIVYKDPAAFDRAGRADVAVMCAQGTLLAGTPDVHLIESLSPQYDEAALLSLAAGAEAASPNSLAISLIHTAIERGARPTDVRSATPAPGLGVSGLAGDGDRLLIGSRAYLLQEKVSVAKADERVSELEAQGRNVLLIALQSRLVGLIALKDGLRPGAKESVQRLNDVGLEPVLLSGDARQTCETVARELGVEHIRPEVLPGDRGAEVRALGAGEGGHVVAVLGRARDDDGALAAADVSVALASAGASPGEWTASLASDDVRDAALALSLAKRVHERARLVMLTSLVASGIGVLVLAFALAPLWIAPLAAFAGSFLAWRIVSTKLSSNVSVQVVSAPDPAGPGDA